MTEVAGSGPDAGTIPRQRPLPFKLSKGMDAIQHPSSPQTPPTPADGLLMAGAGAGLGKGFRAGSLPKLSGPGSQQDEISSTFIPRSASSSSVPTTGGRNLSHLSSVSRGAHRVASTVDAAVAPAPAPVPAPVYTFLSEDALPRCLRGAGGLSAAATADVGASLARFREPKAAATSPFETSFEWRGVKGGGWDLGGRPRATDLNFDKAFVSCLEMSKNKGIGQAAPSRRMRGIDVMHSLRPTTSDPALFNDSDSDDDAGGGMTPQRTDSRGPSRRIPGQHFRDGKRVSVLQSTLQISTKRGDKPDFAALLAEGNDGSGGASASQAQRAGKRDSKTFSSQRRRTSNAVNQDSLAEFQRRFDALSEVALLKNLEADQPGIITKLARAGRTRKEMRGQVIVRQGDSAATFYAVLRGRLGVFKVDDQALRENRQEDPVTGMASIDRLPTLSAFLSKHPKKLATFEQGEMLRQKNGDLVAFRSSDSKSSFTQETDVGKQVGSIEPGNLFGELALLHRETRKATVKCLDECEVMVLDMEVFLSSGMKGAMHKYHTFDKFVTGCGFQHGMGRHPASYFSLERYPKGSKLLVEGSSAEATIFLVQKGAVSFLRCFDEREDPVKELAVTPLESALLWSDQLPKGSSVVETVSEGGMFCSLAALPIQAYEPCTACVTSDHCDMLYVRSSRLRSMPIEFLKPLRDQLLQSTLARFRMAQEQDEATFEEREDEQEKREEER